MLCLGHCKPLQLGRLVCSASDTASNCTQLHVVCPLTDTMSTHLPAGYVFVDAPELFLWFIDLDRPVGCPKPCRLPRDEIVSFKTLLEG